jgi:hypothetical protein
MIPLKNEKDYNMLMQITMQFYQGKRPGIVQRHTEQRLHNNSAIYHKPERALNSTAKLSEKNWKLEWDINSCQYLCICIIRKIKGDPKSKHPNCSERTNLDNLTSSHPHHYLKPVSETPFDHSCVVREVVKNYTDIFLR